MIRDIDWTFVFMVFLPTCAACVLIGYELYRVTHQAGDGGTDVLPMPQPPERPVPDHVPEEWSEPVEEDA